MNVYVLFHDDRYYDMGDAYIRAVFLHEKDAHTSITTRTASGARSKAWDAHNEDCCSVLMFGPFDEAQIERKEDPPPPDPNAVRGISLISRDVIEAMASIAVKESILPRIIREMEKK